MRRRSRFKKIILLFIAVYAVVGYSFMMWDFMIVEAVYANSEATFFKDVIEKYIEKHDGKLPSSKDWRIQLIDNWPAEFISDESEKTNEEIIRNFSINESLLSKHWQWNEIPPNFVIFFESNSGHAVGTISDVKLSWHFRVKARRGYIVTKNETGEIILKETSKPKDMLWEAGEGLQ
jgi:hypothetical protein